MPFCKSIELRNPSTLLASPPASPKPRPSARASCGTSSYSRTIQEENTSERSSRPTNRFSALSHSTTAHRSQSISIQTTITRSDRTWETMERVFEVGCRLLIREIRKWINCKSDRGHALIESIGREHSIQISLVFRWLEGQSASRYLPLRLADASGLTGHPSSRLCNRRINPTRVQ